MLGLLLPWRQQAAKPIEPAMTVLNHPAPCALARFARSPWLPATTAHGRSTAKFAHSRAHFLILIAFIQSHALRPLCCRLRSLRHNALDHRAHQLHVAACRPIHRHPDGDAMTLSQQRPFDARFPTISRIGGRFFTEPWSSPHPSSATPSPRPSVPSSLS
jgi:hypothetical protein